jgi:hypothetical protein
MRLLIDGQGGFVTESREMPRAGLQTTARVGMDDTGARHRGGNGVSTQIGNDDFACLGTTRSNSRLNFLCHPPSPLHSTQELPDAGFFLWRNRTTRSADKGSFLPTPTKNVFLPVYAALLGE